MEQLLIFPVEVLPDPVLARVRRHLLGQGFRTTPSRWYDVAAQRGPDRVFVGLGPHQAGTAARLRTTSLVPGRARRLFHEVSGVLEEALGPREREQDRPGVSP